MMDTDATPCPICNKSTDNGGKTSKLFEKGAHSLNELCSDTEKRFHAGQIVHVNCRRDFCRDANRVKAGVHDESASGLVRERERRSGKPRFEWKEHCFYCGEPAKYDGKKKGYEVVPVRTMELQDTIAEVCKEREDEWANVVRGRLEYARDLHAIDAVYHQQCSSNFRTGRGVPKQYSDSSSDDNLNKRPRQSGRPQDSTRTSAFLKVAQYLEENDDELITVPDLCDKMNEFLEGSDDEAYSPVYMKRKLQEHFADDIIITTIRKRANVVTFKRSAASIIDEFYCAPKQTDMEAEKLRIVQTAAKLIKSEIKNLEVSGETYPSSEDMSSIERAMDFVPVLLKLFLESLLTGKDINLKLASIAQAIVQGTRPRLILAPLQLGLGVQMHHHFASKFLIDTLNSHGFCSSYSTVQNFERSAAATQGTDIPGYTPGAFIQHVADNVDHNIRTLDGLGTFHGMGMIAAVTPGTISSRPIQKRSVTKEEISAAGKIEIRHFKASTNAPILLIKELKDLQVKDSTSNLDLLYKLTQPLVRSPRPAWPGAMQVIFKNGNFPGSSSVLFLPMIDMDPGDMTCIYTTLAFIAAQAKRYDVTAIVTFDQPLYWKAGIIQLNEPESSPVRSIVLRLGAFHAEMSFLGCIGHIMGASGLEDVFELVYAKNAVPHMLTGKAIARAVRAHFLVDAALNSLLVQDAFSLPGETAGEEAPDVDQQQEMENEEVDLEALDGSAEKEPCSTGNKDLEQAAELFKKVLDGETEIEEACSAAILTSLSEKMQSARDAMQNRRTAVLWLQYMTMVDILRKFLKAERTGNWDLHLQAIYDMLPYFAAAGHNLYAKSAYVYLQAMRDLKDTHPEVYQSFKEGLHVVRRSDRYWAGLSTDLVIEQVLMRSLKTSGGLTRGRGMGETQRLIWLLSMPACAGVNSAMQSLTGVNYTTSEQHSKETTHARQQRDYKDLQTVMTYLSTRNPFSEDPSLRNISSGVVADKAVTADKAKEVGSRIIASLVGKNAFYLSFRRKDQVVTQAAKSSVALPGGTVIQVDPQLLFQRLSLVATLGRFDNPQQQFTYELCNYPPALFDSSLLPKQANKAVLADALWAKTKAHHPGALPSGAIHHVLDGGALLHRIPWPRGVTYEAILRLYVDYVTRRYGRATIVFDGYQDGPSIKDCTHQRRTGVHAPTVNFERSMVLNSTKQAFLSNSVNKQRFIDILGNQLQEVGCSVYHSAGDADVLIVQKAMESAKTCDTALVGDDTDLLVLLFYHLNIDDQDVYFIPESKKRSTQTRRIWNIKKAKIALGDPICSNILFVHAILGCDTTSRVHGLGKAVALKKIAENASFLQQARVFMDPTSTRETIIESGERALVCLYGGSPDDKMDSMRYTRFCSKVATGSSFLQPENLPPTSAAAAYHSLRVFFQVQEWRAHNVLEAVDWGWKLTDGQLLPVRTNLPPAHASILEMVRCNCKTNCSTQRCSCRKNGLECSPACGECKGESCLNSPAPDFVDEEAPAL